MDYCLCLKLKQNEIIALAELDDDVLNEITPLFDIPRPKECSEINVKDRVRIGKDKLERYWNKEKTFYLDVYDIPSDLEIDGQSLYEYTLSQLDEFDIIPVIGLNRDKNHLKATNEYLKQNKKVFVGFSRLLKKGHEKEHLPFGPLIFS